jgi:hypothetical protein
MDDFHFAWPFLIPIVAIIGAFTYVDRAHARRARVRELEVRERIAMIERGLVPPPEVDPARLRPGDGPLRALPRAFAGASPPRGRHAHGRRLRPHVLIGVAGDSMSSGIGVGGFLVIMGWRFSSTASSIDSRDDYPGRSRPAPHAAPRHAAPATGLKPPALAQPSGVLARFRRIQRRIHIDTPLRADTPA